MSPKNEEAFWSVPTKHLQATPELANSRMIARETTVGFTGSSTKPCTVPQQGTKGREGYSLLGGVFSAF